MLTRSPDRYRENRSSPPSRAWTYGVVLAVSLGFVMAMLDATVVNVALGSIQVEFSAPLSALVWTIDAYILTFAALLLLGGSLADVLGAKRTYTLGLIWFIAASVLCGLAQSTIALIVARLLQGVGAALFMPSSLSLLTESFPDQNVRTKLVGLWGALVSLAAGSGPFVGGFLVAKFGWRSIFYLNVPVGLLGVALTLLLLRPSPRKKHPFDLTSHGLIIGALAGLSFVLIEGPALGWFFSWRIVVAALVGLIGFGSVLRREFTASHPVIPHTLVRNPHFWALNAMGFLVNFVIFGGIFVVSLFLQQARGATAFTTGVDMLPIMCILPVMNLSSGYLVSRWGGRQIMLIGLVCAAIGATGAAILGGDAPYWSLVEPIALCYAGMALAITPMVAGVMREAGQSDANIGAATLNANRQVGALAGVAVVGIVLHFVGDWNFDLRLAFTAFALCLTGALFLVR